MTFEISDCSNIYTTSNKFLVYIMKLIGLNKLMIGARVLIKPLKYGIHEEIKQHDLCTFIFI